MVYTRHGGGKVMNGVKLKVVLACMIISLLSLIPTYAEQFKATGTVDTYFSPHGGATEAIVKEIDSAKKEILVQAYSFTSTPIAKALVNAHKRGVHVEVVLDKSQ
jgi:phosphatidylserine/phosphatidylglycerophosphate/cardiolipin synthase-like enzyme